MEGHGSSPKFLEMSFHQPHHRQKIPVIRHHVAGGTEHGGGIGRLVSYVLATDGGRLRHSVCDTRGSKWRPLGSSFRLVAAMMAMALSASATVQHLHIAGRGSTLRKLILGCWANMLGRPYVLHLHDYDYAADLDRRPAWQQRAIGRLFTRAAQVIVLGQRDAATVTGRLGVDPSRVVVLRNCVPDPGRRQRQGSAGTRILFLGRLSARKGVPELVEALARPELRDKAWTAVLAGDGEVDETRRALARLGLSDKVRLPGWVDAAAAQKLRDESDILVLPSHAEGFAMSVLEGLAQGMAVVTTRVGAHDEVLEDEVNCLLVPPGDVTALAAALRRLIDDEGLRSRLGQAARRLYETDFSMTRYLHRLEALDAKAIPQPPLFGKLP